MALYRKYRPATFADVVGQEHVTDPLCTALDTGRISHAYLFSGPRGCGKTSSARILARSLNCVEGPTSSPCGTCASCVSLGPGGGGNLDVIELDAASHGGVDDTRELRDRAFYAPAESRYRVFIVDEAHMVTTAGFNALLKIVEEPPAHLIFVFATTEPEKVLPTIRSRTHHYPFRLLPPATMRGLLGDICEQEQVPVDDAVYPLVIRAGGGSPRDSLSVLDQLLAGAGSDGVTYTRAVALLGVTDVALIDDAIDALAAGDGAALFRTVDRVMEAGHDPRRFAVDLLERLRDLILMQAVPDATERGLVAAPGDLLDRMRDQTARLGPATLTRCAELLHAGLGEMRGATAPRLLLEVVCSRMLLPAADTSDAATLQRLEQLERRVASGVAAAPAGAAEPAPVSSGERPAPARPAAADPSRRRGAEALAALRESKAAQTSAGDPSSGEPAPGPVPRPAGQGGASGHTGAATTAAEERPGNTAAARGDHGRSSADNPDAGVSPPVRPDPAGPGRAPDVPPAVGDRGPAAGAGATGSADLPAAPGVGDRDRSSADAGRGEYAGSQIRAGERGRAVSDVGAGELAGAQDSAGEQGRPAAGATAGPQAAAGGYRVARPSEEGRAEAQTGAGGPGRPRSDVDTGDPVGAQVPAGEQGDSVPGVAAGVPAAGGYRVARPGEDTHADAQAAPGDRGRTGAGADDRAAMRPATGDRAGADVAEANRVGVKAAGGDRGGAVAGVPADRPVADHGAPRRPATGPSGSAGPAGANDHAGASAIGERGGIGTRSDTEDRPGTQGAAGDRPAAGVGAADHAGAQAAPGDRGGMSTGPAEDDRAGSPMPGGAGDRERAATSAGGDRSVADHGRPDAGSAAPAGPPGGETDAELLAAVESAWSDIKVKVRDFGPTIGAMLTSGAAVAGVEQGEIVLAHHAALVQRLSQPQPLGAVRSAIAAVLGHEHPVRWMVAGQQIARGPGGRERGGRRSADSESGDSEGGRRGGPRRTWTGRPGTGDGEPGAGEPASGRNAEAAGAAVTAPAGAGSGDAEPNRGPGASGRRSAAPRFSRPSQARGAGAAAVDPGAGAGNSAGSGAGSPYDDIPPPDYPDLPDDPGPDDYGYGSGAVPASTPEEEQEMLADAARPVDPGQRRDPDEVALELLTSELGATPLNG